MKQIPYYKGIIILGIIATFLMILKSIEVEKEEVVETHDMENLEEENSRILDVENNGDSEATECIDDEIRVLIKDTGYVNTTHEELEVSAESGLCITYEDGLIEFVEPGERFLVDKGKIGGESIQITTIDEEDKISIHSIERNYGTPKYAGILEVFVEAEYIVVVNELNLETYLKSVLPSEMPASYEMEALKAQAVCARSYAYCHMSEYAYPEYLAHVDDSTSYQVYNNAQEAESCNLAIEETAGEKVYVDEEVVLTYFFSTSCGSTTDITAWCVEETLGYEYLKSIQVSDGEQDYEADLPWYAWEVIVSKEALGDILEKNVTEYFGTFRSVSVTQYGAGDVALVLEVVGTDGSVEIKGENAIRKALGSSTYIIERQDGSTVQGSSLLPSAFFTMSFSNGEYRISGGGYGHGIGLSQNGANEMAKLGYTYKEILKKFYDGVEILV